MLNLKSILAKQISALEDAEKQYLREHASELSDDQKTAYKEVLEEKELDMDSAKEMVAKAFDEAIEKRASKMADEIVSKFYAGAAEARAKALANGEQVTETEKAKSTTREFMKALISGDKDKLKALSTTVGGDDPDDASAGVTVPEELRAEVLRIAETQYGIARREFFYLPFSGPGNTRTIPTLGTSVTVYWTDEQGKKKSTQPKFSVVTQTLKKLAAIVPMTEEILEDSAVNLTQLVAQLFAEAVAKEEDLQFFAGTGSPWTGLLNNANLNSVNQASGDATQITADDLLDMIDATPSGALAGAKFQMHRTVLSRIRRLKTSDGTYIYQNPGGGMPATIWDYPVVTNDAFPALADVSTNEPYVLFGNLKQGAIFGDKQQLRIKLLTEATITDTDGETVVNLAEQDMVALRVVERVGYVVGLAKAMTVLKAQATVSP